MLQHGNTFYKVVKLIEPAANLKIIPLSQRFQPQVKTSDDFESFVHGTIKNLEREEDIKSLPFLKVILDEGNLETVLLFYGCFHHWEHPFIDYM